MQLMTFNGDQMAYPMYLSIGNMAKHICCKPSLHAQILVGYLPTPKLSDFSEEAACTVCVRLFHAALSIIMQSLKGPEHEGVEMKSADGAVHQCHLVIAVYIMDYPEQSLIACMCQGSQCLKCHAVEIEFEDHNLNWRSRKQDAMLNTLHHGAQQSTAKHKEMVLKGASLTHMEEPFWAGFRYCNIQDTISPDILHQLFQGLFRYMVIWVWSIVGTMELDAQFKCLPCTHGVRSFDNGISCLSKVSTGEHKEICKQLLGCIIGKAPTGVIRAMHVLLDFIHLVQYQSHSDETLKYLQASLDEFHKDKKIFLDLKARTSGHFNLPKLHTMQHYVDSTRECGTTDNYNTEATEHLHIDYAKDAYCTTNKKDYLQQMEPIAIPFNNVQVWDPVKFQLKHLQLDDGPAIMDTAVEMPSQGTKSTQFDTILVAVDDDAEDTGVQGRILFIVLIFE
ncbi:hypothetical protein EWM64_g8345 [Hericium alpestre]|uniref:CxC2-like cysteine cluster KDZ transposase-associated domain-containing protein n=1 Tax=Hericium alpestre TaxID=135208 RepID=A0A4Y9ZNP2_9AGAM|nr:hypothetical protein EWM64_g8345 [Hericium alpestre]